MGEADYRRGTVNTITHEREYTATQYNHGILKKICITGFTVKTNASQIGKLNWTIFTGIIRHTIIGKFHRETFKPSNVLVY